jgi:hypothetical protein
VPAVLAAPTVATVDEARPIARAFARRKLRADGTSSSDERKIRLLRASSS